MLVALKFCAQAARDAPVIGKCRELGFRIVQQQINLVQAAHIGIVAFAFFALGQWLWRQRKQPARQNRGLARPQTDLFDAVGILAPVCPRDAAL